MESRRNTILVTIDSLRADHCHFMGYDREVTPTLDDMAEDGLVFSNAIAPGPATGGSVPATVTGSRPVESPDRGPDNSDWGEKVRHHFLARETIAERFSRLGYETGAFTTNPWASRQYGFDAGFDHFEDFLGDDSNGDDTPKLRGDSTFARVWGHLEDWWRNNDVFLPWEAYVEEVLDWIDTVEEPYFLWVFLIDVHMPYHPPAEFRSRSAVATVPAHVWLLTGGDPRLGPLFRSPLVDAYDDSIRYADAFLGHLRDEVGTDPLLVVHGDHGDEFGEHGAYGHGSNLCEEVINVPLVVANGPTGWVERPVSLSELPDVLLSLAQEEEVDLEDPYVYSGNPNRLAVRGDRWKYVWNSGDSKLYHLEDGSEEQVDHPALGNIGEQLVTEWRENRNERRRIREAVATVTGENGL